MAWGNGQSQHIASNDLEDEVQELQNEREFAIPNQNEDAVSDINDEETGVAEPEIPTEELDEYVELEQPPAHEPPRYAVHGDIISHSRMVYTTGGGTFLAKSTKPSVVSKSSTEAEVIAASDGCNDLLSLMEFINF